MQRSVLILVLAAFSVLSALAVWEHGYLGLFAWQLANTAGMQVLADLGIALALVLGWLWRDARRSGRQPGPWVVLTLAAGSFGPLLYLLFRPGRPTRADTRPAPDAAGPVQGRSA